MPRTVLLTIALLVATAACSSADGGYTPDGVVKEESLVVVFRAHGEEMLCLEFFESVKDEHTTMGFYGLTCDWGGSMTTPNAGVTVLDQDSYSFFTYKRPDGVRVPCIRYTDRIKKEHVSEGYYGHSCDWELLSIVATG